MGSGRGREPVAMTMCFASMVRFADSHSVSANEVGAVAKEIDAALLKRLGERVGDAAAHLLFAVDQPRPVELGLAYADAMHVGLVDLVQRVARGDQHFFRRAASVRAGAAEIALLDQRHFEPRLSGWHGDAEAGIAAAEDQHIIAVACHAPDLSERGRSVPMPKAYGCHSRGQGTRGAAASFHSKVLMWVEQPPYGATGMELRRR